jgi:hypothetical protein
MFTKIYLMRDEKMILKAEFLEVFINRKLEIYMISKIQDNQ